MDPIEEPNTSISSTNDSKNTQLHFRKFFFRNPYFPHNSYSPQTDSNADFIALLKSHLFQQHFLFAVTRWYNSHTKRRHSGAGEKVTHNINVVRTKRQNVILSSWASLDLPGSQKQLTIGLKNALGAVTMTL